MAADNSLITAAFKEATSRAGTNVPNLKPLYEGQAKVSQGYIDLVSNTFKAYKQAEEVKQVGRDAQLNVFKKTLSKHYKNIESGATMPQKVINAVDDEVKRLQKEFEAVNTYGKNDNEENERARMRINARLEKIIAEAKNATTTFATLQNNSNDWIEGALDENVIAAQGKMMSEDIDIDPNTNVQFVNGKLTYFTTLEDRPFSASYNLEQMASNFPAVDLKKQSEIQNLSKDYVNSAQQRKRSGESSNYNADNAKQEVSKMIKTNDDFMTLALAKNDLNENTFAQELKNGNISPIDLTVMDAVFSDMFKESLDKDNNDIIDDRDLKKLVEQGINKEQQETWTRSYDSMISALTDIRDPNFNLQRSKPLLVDYYNTIMEYRYNVAIGDSDSNTIILLGQTVSAPKSVKEKEQVAAIRSIEKQNNEVVIGKEIYVWNNQNQTYDLNRRSGGGFSPYDQEYLDSLPQYQYTKKELIDSRISIYNVGDNYDFIQGR